MIAASWPAIAGDKALQQGCAPTFKHSASKDNEFL
jgi:hypothetical protein